MSDIVKKYYEDMSDREIMDSKRIKNIAEDEINQTVKILKKNILNCLKNLNKSKKKCMKCLLVSIWIMV
jgi:hypothetical protein